MKEIKEITDEVKKEAHTNVEDFDLTKLCYKNIFELMNNSGVFVKAFSELLTYDIVDKNQIRLISFKYNYIEEADERIYPSVDLILGVAHFDALFEANFCLTLTHFNAKLDNVEKNAGVYGKCDRELSKTWRIVMKGFFKKKYVEAFKQFCVEARVIKECAIMVEAEKQYLKNERFYEEEINSI